jgi:hypothetical protein
VFRHPGYLEASLLYSPILKSRLVKPRNGIACLEFGCFGVLAPGEPRCETSCLPVARNPDLQNPEMIERGQVMMFQSFGSRETQVRNPHVLTYCEIPKGEIPKWISTHGFGVSAFWYPGSPKVSFPRVH